MKDEHATTSLRLGSYDELSVALPDPLIYQPQFWIGIVFVSAFFVILFFCVQKIVKRFKK